MDGELPTASELAPLLPNWYCSRPGRPPIDYTGLKAAAVVVASASEEDQRSLIKEYSRAYCDSSEHTLGACDRSKLIEVRDSAWAMRPRADPHKAAGMFLLLRVLFVLPAHYPAADARGFTWWMQKWPAGDVAARKPSTERDLAWPVHEVAGGHVLLVDHFDSPGYYAGAPSPYYLALAEYDWFASRFPRRTPEEIDALEIKPVDDSHTPADALGVR